MTKRILGTTLLWLVGIALVRALSGGPAWSVDLYRSVAVEPLIGLGAWVSEAALLALVTLYAMAGLWLLLARPRDQALRWGRLIRLVFGGVAACLSYGINLVLKGSFAAVRPCHLHDVVSVCPPADSWSFPSNHSVIAFSLMTGVIVAWPRLAWVAVPLALLTACARVLAGDHYPHDVLAGAALGTLFCLGLTLVISPALDRAQARWSRATVPRLHQEGAAAESGR